MTPFDSNSQRLNFPILNQKIHDEQLIYLDNGATTQKPKQVINEMVAYYETMNANVHRGVHTLSEKATKQYELAREKVRNFIKAKSTKEIIFTRGATTSLNWVAHFAGEILKEGDEVLISIMEHHANIVPWQEVCRKTGAKLVYAYLKHGEELDMADFSQKLTKKTKFVSIAHVSNVLGCLNPIKEITQLAHEVGAYMVVDAAQSAPHLAIDVSDLDCDFLAFSGHKMLAPTGIGVLYGKEELLNQMSPVEFGGEMIDFVYEQSATWTELPWKFEAGTPNIAGAIGLGAAIDYLTSIGMEEIAKHDEHLMTYLLPKLENIAGLTLYGPRNPKQHFGVISFNLDNLHPHDVATALDYEGVAVRAGHHCAQPLLRYMGLFSTVRASFYLYNTLDDCDRLIEAIEKTKEFFNGTF